MSTKKYTHCSKCGTTDDIALSGYICRQCKRMYNKKYRIDTDEPVRDKIKTLLKYIISSYEAGITKSQMELIYIDSCKILGHDRKKYMIEHRRRIN
jgi:hypothetical protein